MRKKTSILLVCLVVLAIAGFITRALIRREPAYQGRPLSSWFKLYCASGRYSGTENPFDHKEAARAIRAIGTNALPFLLEKLFNTRPDAPWETNVWRFLRRLPEPIRFPPFVSANTIRSEAGNAIGEIRPPAALLLPRLETALHDTNHIHYHAAIWLLGTIGEGAEQGVPYLLRELAIPDWGRQFGAEFALGRLGPAAKDAVPALAEFVSSPSTHRVVRRKAVQTLGDIGMAASNAVPALSSHLLTETNLNLRSEAAVALCKIDPREPAGWSFLVKQLGENESDVTRSAFAYRLAQFGPEAKAAVPALQKMLVSPNPELWRSAAYALHKTGVDHALIFPKLLAELEASTDDQARLNVVMTILTIAPDNVTAQDVAMALIRTNSRWRNVAMATLGDAGPPAKRAIPVLRAQLKNKDKWVRKQATEALRRIESGETSRDGEH